MENYNLKPKETPGFLIESKEEYNKEIEEFTKRIDTLEGLILDTNNMIESTSDLGIKERLKEQIEIFKEKTKEYLMVIEELGHQLKDLER